MQKNFAYLVNPNPHVERQLARRSIDTENLIAGLDGPLLWTGEEGDFTPVTPEMYTDFVKLVFLGFVKHYVKEKILADLFDNKFEISTTFFDRYWDISRFRLNYFVDYEFNQLPIHILKEFASTGTIIDKWVQAAMSER